MSLLSVLGGGAEEWMGGMAEESNKSAGGGDEWSDISHDTINLDAHKLRVSSNSGSLKLPLPT